jgi:hypothetical protein
MRSAFAQLLSGLVLTAAPTGSAMGASLIKVLYDWLSGGACRADDRHAKMRPM